MRLPHSFSCSAIFHPQGFASEATHCVRRLTVIGCNNDCGTKLVLITKPRLAWWFQHVLSEKPLREISIARQDVGALTSARTFFFHFFFEDTLLTTELFFKMRYYLFKLSFRRYEPDSKYIPSSIVFLVWILIKDDFGRLSFITWKENHQIVLPSPLYPEGKSNETRPVELIFR